MTFRAKIVTPLGTFERRYEKEEDFERLVFLGPAGAVELWRRWYREGQWAAGIEQHHRRPPRWLHDRQTIGPPPPPTHERCKLLRGACWCDGSGIWAEEYWMPLLKSNGYSAVFDRLEEYYCDIFEDKEYKKQYMNIWSKCDENSQNCSLQSQVVDDSWVIISQEKLCFCIKYIMGLYSLSS